MEDVTSVSALLEERASSSRERAPFVRANTLREIARRWPKSTVCVLASTIGSYYAFYGARTVLTLYILNVLNFNSSHATAFFNTFNATVYTASIIGSLLADSYYGRVRAYIITSAIYASGLALLTFSATNAPASALHPWLDIAGLAAFALGAGSMKPCLVPHGGDQFDSRETRSISIYFSIFYFAVNVAAGIGQFTSPYFRQTPCLGQQTCFPLAFGVAGALVTVAIVSMALGRRSYRKMQPPQSNTCKRVLQTIGVSANVEATLFVVAEVYNFQRALKLRRHAENRRAHWLDYALDNHSCENSAACRRREENASSSSDNCEEARFVDEIKSIFRVTLMVSPAIIFWSLNDQQGSVWAQQALLMDSRLWRDDVLLLPDQMQTLNSLFVLLLIPPFELIVYPLLRKFINLTMLKKMVTGCFLAAAAFFLAALVQRSVNKSLPQLPAADRAYISLVNTLNFDCTLNVTTLSDDVEPKNAIVQSHTALENSYASKHMFNVPHGRSVVFNFEYLGESCASQTSLLPKQTSFITQSKNDEINFIHVSANGIFLASASTLKPKDGLGGFATGITIALNEPYDDSIALCRVAHRTSADCNPRSKADYYAFTQKEAHRFYYVQRENSSSSKRFSLVFDVRSVRPGTWRLYYVRGEPKKRSDVHAEFTGVEFRRVEQGGVYMLSLSGERANASLTQLRTTDDNQVSILWQMPQIIVIVIADLLFSLTSIEFAYSQAAPSLKSIIYAITLQMTALGDLLIVIITLLRISSNGAIMFLIYAGLMTITSCFYIVASMRYTYVNYKNTSEEDDEESDEMN